MVKKSTIAMGIGLVVLIIAAGIAYQNYEYAQLSKKQVEALSSVIQQKDVEIAKLTKTVKTKQDELGTVKLELDKVKKTLDEAKAQINKVVEQPAVPALPVVNK
jgi:septal ring factor EnvC (AmiA/AmiB activator)